MPMFWMSGQQLRAKRKESDVQQNKGKLRSNYRGVISRRHSWQTWNVKLKVHCIWYRIFRSSHLTWKGRWRVTCFWGIMTPWQFNLWKISFFQNFACHSKHLMTGSKGNSEFCFPKWVLFPLALPWETLRMSRK